MPDGKALASGVMGMDHCVRTFIAATGVPLPEAVRMATLTPARIAGVDNEIGSIVPGKKADLVVTDAEFNVRSVYLAGRPLQLEVPNRGSIQMRCLAITLLTVSLIHAEAPADLGTRKGGSDWPRFLGPDGDGVSPEKGILTKWPKGGLKVLWEAPMGQGFAPPVVSRGRLFHFDRFGNDNRLSCRNAETGKLLWKFEYPANYDDLYGYSPGPRACPVVDDDRVFILGPEGMLHCVAAVDGKEIWKLDTKKAYHFHQNFFGVGSVPVVEGDLLIVAVGGSPEGARD